MVVNLNFFLNVGHGAQILRPLANTVWRGFKTDFACQERRFGDIFSSENDNFFNHFCPLRGRSWTFWQKIGAFLSNLHSTCPEENFKQFFFENRLFSSFFDIQRKFPWQKLFRRVLKIAHLTAKRNPWFRINFVWKKFLSFSNFQQNFVVLIKIFWQAYHNRVLRFKWNT